MAINKKHLLNQPTIKPLVLYISYVIKVILNAEKFVWSPSVVDLFADIGGECLQN
jgi:hypothetical protein